jgi:hypothetical protein
MQSIHQVCSMLMTEGVIAAALPRFCVLWDRMGYHQLQLFRDKPLCVAGRPEWPVWVVLNDKIFVLQMSWASLGRLTVVVAPLMLRSQAVILEIGRWMQELSRKGLGALCLLVRKMLTPLIQLLPNSVI